MGSGTAQDKRNTQLGGGKEIFIFYVYKGFRRVRGPAATQAKITNDERISVKLRGTLENKVNKNVY